MGKSKYKSSWQTNRSWLKPVNENEEKAKCTLCKSEFFISNSGIGQVKKHEETVKHKQLEKEIKNNSALNTDKGRIELLLPQPKPVSLEEQVTRAEVIQAFHVINANLPFRSADTDAERFRMQFPDSEIAKLYKQSRSKLGYVIEYGIAPVLIKNLKTDIIGKPLSIKFDETTTSQVKKQFDAYLTYYCEKSACVITSYCGSLFVGHCPAKVLLEHINHFIDSLGINREHIMAVGLDGPTVNITFLTYFLEDLNSKWNTRILDTGTCPLHIVNNGFSKVLKSLKPTIDLDQFAIDLHFFMKQEEKTIKPLQIVQTRWLSIQKVLLRIIEQFTNLKEYYIEFLPKQKGFNYKEGVGKTERYTRIKNLLSGPSFMPYAHFVITVAQDFKKFVLLFQRNEPMIHALHPEMMTLMQRLLSRFIKPDAILNKKGGLKSVTKLAKLNLCDENIQKVEVDCGAKAKEACKSLLNPLERKVFHEICRKSLVETASYLIEKLPLSNQVIYDSKYMSPLERSNPNLPKALVRLSHEVGEALGDKEMRKLFELGDTDTVLNLSDAIEEEAKFYQAELIPDHFYLKDKQVDVDVLLTTPARPSYWRDAYQVVGGIESDPLPDTNMDRVEDYWRKVSEIKNPSVQPKFAKLYKLATHCVAVLPHGNAEPERGFSVNGQVIDVHGPNIGEDMIIAIRTVKDFIINSGGAIKEEFITADLIKSASTSGQRYKSDMLEKKRLKEEKERADAERNNAALAELEKKKKVERLDREIITLRSGIVSAEQSIQCGNEEMSSLIRSENLSREKLAQAQAKIEMGLKRKADLSLEIDNLVKEKKQL